MTYEELQKQLKSVAMVRAANQGNIDDLDDIIDRLKSMRSKMNEEITTEEDAYRIMVQEYVSETGSTELPLGSKFSRRFSLAYDENDAIAWCKANGREDLVKVIEKLDKNGFKKIANESDLAESVPSPTVSIDKDLSDLL